MKKLQGHVRRLEALEELYPEIVKWDQLLEDLGMKNKRVRSSILQLRSELKEHIYEIKHVIRKEQRKERKGYQYSNH